MLLRYRLRLSRQPRWLLRPKQPRLLSTIIRGATMGRVWGARAPPASQGPQGASQS